MSLLTTLVLANLAAAVAILAVFALRPLMRPRFGAHAVYALWFAPLFAAAAVLIPHATAATPIAPMVVDAQASAEAFVAVLPRAGLPVPDLGTLLLAGWLIGAATAASLLVRRQVRFMRALGGLEAMAAPSLFRARNADVGPAVVGLLRPRIIAPADFETRFTADEQRLVLAHERAHLASGDAAVNALACAAQCLCWFNPLVHLAVRAMRIDQEIACDAAVAASFPAERRLYAELLLKTQLAGDPLPLGCHWPAGAAHPLKARILMLKSPAIERPERIAGLGVAVLLTIGAASAAWAAAPAATPLAKAAPVALPFAKPSALTPPTPVVAPNPVTASVAALPEPAQSRPPTAPIELAQAAAPSPSIITMPDWAQKPTGEDLADVYPPAAVQAHLEGRATIACVTTVEGLLADCKVIVEDPPGAGFGEAALALAARFKMRPMTKDGHPVAGGNVRIPILFRLPPPPAAPATTPGA